MRKEKRKANDTLDCSKSPFFKTISCILFLQDDIKGFLFKLTLLRLRNNLIYLWCSWWGLRSVFWALKGSMTKWGDLLYELTKAGAQDISGTPETYELGRKKRTIFLGKSKDAFANSRTFT